ncbi:MAG: GTP-binding protein [Candidatus Omnitrophica bacterium]|jgi:sulfate adenylyltransferase large subunit|nr:GTP-binding protein [Candidatus Omnitrophota bacterium]
MSDVNGNPQNNQSGELRIVFVGHVDHGKSTLVGRLLHETDSILPQKLEYVKQICVDKGVKFEYAFLLDALEEEQDQGITIDVSQVLFKTKKRTYRVIDAPGHKEFLKNMISGASSADAALLLIDAKEGLREQSKRHATILSLLGIKNIIVIVNKMDLVGYSEETFNKLVTDYTNYLKTLKVTPKAFIPVSAYVGDNVVMRTSQMPWYKGSTLVEILDSVDSHRTASTRALRFPLQDVYRFDSEKRYFSGRIESGRLKKGDEILFLPSKKTAVVSAIERWNAPEPPEAEAGESIGITVEDQLFVERGEIAVHASAKPLVGKHFRANIFWMGEEHLAKGKSYVIKLTTQELECKVKNVVRVINSSTLDEVSKDHHEVAKNEVAELELEFKKDIVYDPFHEIQETGRFVLVDRNLVSGGGIILHA